MNINNTRTTTTTCFFEVLKNDEEYHENTAAVNSLNGLILLKFSLPLSRVRVSAVTVLR